jgi:hypothetical protein
MRRLVSGLPHDRLHLVDTLNSVLNLMDRELTTTSRGKLLSIDSWNRAGASSSLGMAPLTELLERFNMHDATDRRDKIYALLGLSNDLHKFPALWADYDKPWSDLLRDVVAQFLGPALSIYTWDEQEGAVITGSGCPLGTLFHKPDGGLTFRSPSFSGIRSVTIHWQPEFPLSGNDNNILDGDILCIMEGARYPSVIRRHNGHFILVKIALTKPPGFEIIRISGNDLKSFLDWEAFAKCIAKFPRQFTLIWDWSTDADHFDERCTRMLETVEATGTTSVTVQARFLNMTRILEDMDDKNSLISLLHHHQHVPEEPAWVTRYCTIFRYLCDCWADYNQLKVYVSQLRWSSWIMSNQTTGDPAIEFWRAEGILNLGLVDLLPPEEPTRRIEDGKAPETKQQIWTFGEEGLIPVLDILAPGSTRLATTASTTHDYTSSVTLFRQRMFQMIFADDEVRQLHPKAMLDMLDRDPDLFEATKLSLTILSDISGMKAELTRYILQRLRRPKARPNWELFTLLLEGSFADTSSVIAILEEAQIWSLRGVNEHHETCSKFLMPCTSILYKYIINTDLCVALVDQWEIELRDTPSILEFLCNTFTLPFKDTLACSEGALIKSIDYPRSKAARIDLARKCLLSAIHTMAPWVKGSPGELDSATQENDLVTLMASMQLLWSSKERASPPL